MEMLVPLLTDHLSKHLALTVQPSEIERPSDLEHGDLAFPTFRYAKARNLTPQDLAKEISLSFRSVPEINKHFEVYPMGAYVNFKLTNQSLLDLVLSPSLDGTYGHRPDSLGPKKKWVLEFSSPNVAKPFMIYHFRGTGVGASLARIARKRGLDVSTINHIGDWGTQFGKLYVANQRYRAGNPEIDRFESLVEMYVKFHQELETNPELESEGRSAFIRLEQKDPVVTAFWKSCVAISLKEFEKIYKLLNVEFDHTWGESFYESKLSPLLADLKSKNILELSEGAYVARVKDAKGKELTPVILQKTDGSTIYATRDVAALIYRYETFKFDKMIYVVGGEQKLHFEQVFGVVRAMGEKFVEKCEHVATGLYRFKDKKMSTRKGNFVTFEDVFALVKDRVRERMSERSGEETPNESNIEKIALASIVYHDLATDPARDLEFDVSQVTDFEGETGPYLQYAHTRCLSVIRKSEERGYSTKCTNSSALLAEINSDVSRRLLRNIAQYPFALERVLTTKKPSALARNLMDIAQSFGAFYRERHILTDSKDEGEARLQLVLATRAILKDGLSLLGIPTPEKM